MPCERAASNSPARSREHRLHLRGRGPVGRSRTRSPFVAATRTAPGPGSAVPPTEMFREGMMGHRLKKLSDQVVVITGASSGIGLCTAKMAASRGARVVLAARGEEG